MNILMPMAGAGSRFTNAGYKTHKPVIPTTYWKNGIKYPMVICAINDLPDKDKSNLIVIGRDFHTASGIDKQIKQFFPLCNFLTVDKLTEGQASTCLLAKDYINNYNELLIAGCDNGMIYDYNKFISEKQDADVLVFTHRFHQLILSNPSAYGWCVVDENNFITSMSVKKPISDNPLNDHAVVATFWFKKGSYFVQAAEKMIAENDRINNEFYVDQVIKHIIDLGYKAKVFQVDKYLCWGTPQDYENYENTLKYWFEFQHKDKLASELIK